MESGVAARTPRADRGAALATAEDALLQRKLEAAALLNTPLKGQDERRQYLQFVVAAESQPPVYVVRKERGRNPEGRKEAVYWLVKQRWKAQAKARETRREAAQRASLSDAVSNVSALSDNLGVEGVAGNHARVVRGEFGK